MKFVPRTAIECAGDVPGPIKFAALINGTIYEMGIEHCLEMRAKYIVMVGRAFGMSDWASAFPGDANGGEIGFLSKNYMKQAKRFWVRQAIGAYKTRTTGRTPR